MKLANRTLVRAAWTCFFAASLAPAQFRHLATTYDGSRAWFISTLRQPGTDQHLYTKIFSIDASGVSLVYQPPPPSPDPFGSATLDRLQAAADGSWLVYGQLRSCRGGSSCFLNEQRSSVLLPPRSDNPFLGGNARLSSDGRWVFSYSSPNVLAGFTSLTDLQTGNRVSIDRLRLNAEPSVARNGAILIPSVTGLLLWQNGNARTLAGPVTAAVMDDDATTVVYQETPDLLRVIDLPTGNTWPLGAWERDDTAARLSADGRYVLYLSGMYNGPQVFFSARDGSGWHQFTDEEGGIEEAVLSGDGRVAWAVTQRGAVLRIDTISGVVDKRIEETPWVPVVPAGVPGSAIELAGTSLEGRQVLLGGHSAPVQLAQAARIRFQVPWETPLGDTELRLEPGTPYFDVAFPFTVRNLAPLAIAKGECRNQDCIPPVAIHEDWTSLVTEDNPAVPGEVVHIYATGLGEVNPPVPTGVPSPADPLSRTVTDFQWTWSVTVAGPVTAEVLFSGLAPGLIGYYQIDVRLPAAADFSPVTLNQGFSPFAYIPVRQSGS